MPHLRCLTFDATTGAVKPHLYLCTYLSSSATYLFAINSSLRPLTSRSSRTPPLAAFLWSTRHVHHTTMVSPKSVWATRDAFDVCYIFQQFSEVRSGLIINVFETKHLHDRPVFATDQAVFASDQRILATNPPTQLTSPGNQSARLHDKPVFATDQYVFMSDQPVLATNL